MDTNTTPTTSKSIGNTEVSQAGSSSEYLATDLTFDLDTASANVDSSSVNHGDGGEMIQSAKDDVNITKDPGLWLHFFASDVAYVCLWTQRLLTPQWAF